MKSYQAVFQVHVELYIRVAIASNICVKGASYLFRTLGTHRPGGDET